MFLKRHRAGRWSVSITLAASMLLSGPAALAQHVPDADGSIGSGQVNQTYNQLNAGNYYNTNGGSTTFQNSSSLHLKSGTMHGFEVDTAGAGYATNGNGGSFVIKAPTVRLDGNIDVSGFIKNGSMGNGGNVVIQSQFLYQNGQIYANGANGGSVAINTGTMFMGDNAAIQARGLTGAGGVVNIQGTGTIDIAKGAVIDTSGAIVGTYNTNVIHVEGGLVNMDGVLMANGVNPGQRGGIVQVVANGKSTVLDSAAMNKAVADGTITFAERSSLGARDAQLRAAQNGDVRIGGDAQITANGANGTIGTTNGVPENGGDGGAVRIYAVRHVVNDGLIAANGGNGSYNPDIANGAPVNGVQESYGEHGGNGGNGGGVLISYGKTVSNNGRIEVKGGNGGAGQQAIAEDPNAYKHVAVGGNGGNGGNGGEVEFIGGKGATLPSQIALNNINVNGGSGGSGGSASIPANSCGCVEQGSKGACGVPGQIKMSVDKLPPDTPPNTPPGYPPYPREYTRLGEALPGGVGPVLSYNRSIFMARAPLPIIKKKTPPPPPKVTQIVPPPVVPKPKAPPQKKQTVRGYW